jgi:large subunit ribosomal protein L24e
MPSSHTCSYCGNNIPAGTGLMYIKNDGTILWFCSSKCRKYMLKYRRDPKKFKWTSSYSRVR